MANSKVALLRYIRIARGWRRVRVEAIRRGRGWDERIGAPEGAEILERGEFQLRRYRGSNAVGVDPTATLMKTAVVLHRRTEDRRQEELARQRRQEELAKLRHAIEQEEKRVQKLEDEAERWERAKRIREYVLTAVETRKEAGEELGPDTALGSWTAWALQQADRIDPLTKSRTSVLDHKKELKE
jgi:hypothetical protein